MPRSLASLPLLCVLLSGCCGGYSVVRTTMADHAQVREGGDLVRSPESAVLHYSRLGEPPNACGSDVKYVEDLWIQVPSLNPGQAYTLGAPGVRTTYARQQGEEKMGAARIEGQVAIKERTADGLSVALAVTITLPSGATVKLDDDYAFHPMTGGEGQGEQSAVERAVRGTCRGGAAPLGSGAWNTVGSANQGSRSASSRSAPGSPSATSSATGWRPSA